ncbi:MAG: MarR family transcriptional regulator [Clostridia bacterium]|nr:MarR family transcriptional regulator [Clostridia bacterium]
MTTNVKLMVVLNKLNYAFMNELSKNLEQLGMTASAYPMLAHLNEVGRAKTQKLGEVAVITSGTITHIVNKLVENGYVKKVQDEKDKRVFWVEITDAGRREFLRVNDEHMKYLDKLLSDFSEQEKLTFIEQIKAFGKCIEKKKALQ